VLKENYVAKQERIGERLSRAMARAHMDRRELAALTGYGEAQIVQWERGRAVLYPNELIKLCHALDVKPEWLLCWERRLHCQRLGSVRHATDIRRLGLTPFQMAERPTVSHLTGFSFQLKSGRTLVPRLPQTVQVNLPSISDSRTSSGQRSALIATEWLQP
jgi:hypothetical protein